MQHVQETNLARSLIDAAKPQLDMRERNHIFISVGAGDPFTAIRILLKLIDIKHIPLHPRLVRLCTTWLEAYALHEDHERMRVLIDGFTVPDAVQRPWATVRSLSCPRDRSAQAISPDVNERHRGGVMRVG